jgi:hypothetical protein
MRQDWEIEHGTLIRVIVSNRNYDTGVITMSRNIFSKTFIFILIFLSSFSLQASELVCSIKSVSKLGDNGFFVTHGWSANYLNREFTVERETGRVLRTTALKQRLSNFNKEHAPILLNSGDQTDALKAITIYESSGQYALLEIGSTPAGNPRPFFYHTDVGMILSGTCIEGA